MTEPATCMITGDPHYKSFDGYRHDFQGGDCRFTLVSVLHLIILLQLPNLWGKNLETVSAC